ncbi:MAG TPA: hypothetical protein VF951_05710 [Streptosporangiaceae bacterium]
MNELEDLVREELRARAAAAEAAAADELAPLVAALERRIRRARLRRRWTAAALSAVAVAGVIVLPLTLLSPGPAGVNPLFRGPRGPVPLTDTAATPSGWAPVANGNAQISVPADWRVSTRPVCGRAAPGYVVLGSASISLRVRNPRCRQALNMAAILPLHRPYPAGGNPTAYVNGIPVVKLPIAHGFESYLVLPLHAWVTARGPLASRVLATLTRSPLSVVLAAGPRFAVPHGWRWHDFGGIRFAAPESWRLEQSSTWGNCAGAYWMDPRSVQLTTARSAIRLRCAAMLGMAARMTVRQGVIVGAGRMARLDPAQFDGCRMLHGLRACYSASFYQDGLLDVAVFVPGRHRPTVVEIGLAGNGTVARTIFESIGPG